MTECRLPPSRILVVDSSAPTRKLYRSVLTGFGISEIYEADTTKAALETLKTFSVDIVITELRLEPTDGIGFVQTVRSTKFNGNPHVPILMVSSETSKPRVIAALEAGVTEFLAKPIVPNSIYRRLLAMITCPSPGGRNRNFPAPAKAKTARWEI